MLFEKYRIYATSSDVIGKRSNQILKFSISEFKFHIQYLSYFRGRDFRSIRSKFSNKFQKDIQNN